MSHEWKFGDWAESPLGIVRFVSVAGENLVHALRADGLISPFEVRYMRHLPGCTGFDWKQPEPPPGYRLVAEDEFETAIRFSDKFIKDNYEWGDTGLSNMTIREAMSRYGVKAYARKIEPPPGYRLLDKSEARLEGDIYFNDSDGTWKYSDAVDASQVPFLTYARKIEPQYRPFANAAEYEPFFYMAVVEGSWTYKVSGFGNDSIQYGRNTIPYRIAFEQLKFKDGTPFGVKET